MTTTKQEWESRLEIPGRVTFQEGRGELPSIEVTTPWSEAEIYLHGAHVTHFQRRGEPPLLFLSKMSRFVEDAPIRGGVPVILPWFGPRQRQPSHGFARIKPWDLREITLSADGSARLHFRFSNRSKTAGFGPFTADYVVSVGAALALELEVTNDDPQTALVFEECLHTYFAVGDIGAVQIRGLQGARYMDACDEHAPKTDKAAALAIAAEVDRIYVDSTETVEILDRNSLRQIRVEKRGSRSTVVWNPWLAKAQRLPDFGNEEYRQMLCVESGNVAANKLSLRPHRSHHLKITLSTSRLV